MEPRPITDILDWSNGRLERGGPGTIVYGVSIDSRRIRPGEIFLAVAGESYDGHNFAAAALKAGAVGVILSREVAAVKRCRENFCLIRVKDTLQALAGLARGYRRLFDLPAIAVTGSNGKTTTKNLIGLFLESVGPVLTAPASYNNLIGVSLSILKLAAPQRAAVFELGTNRPGEIRELARLCRPQLAVITNIGPAHLGRFGDLDRIAAEKGELIGELKPPGVVFLNTDDPRTAALAGRSSGEIIGFGFNPPARVRPLDVRCKPGGVSFKATLRGGELPIEAPIPGRHNIFNLLAALAVGDYFRVEPAALQAAARRVVLPPGRMERISLGGVEYINDAYNANPASMVAALKTWREMECRGRRILVSGDMHELEEFSRPAHRELGERLARSGIDYLIFFGPLSRTAARAAREVSPAAKVETADDCFQVGEILAGLVRPGDSVLLKGSRKMGMEEIIEIMRRWGKQESRI